MDEVIEKKFGKNFRNKLLREADELIIANNDTVDAYECDIKPEIYGLETNNVIYLSAKGLNVKRNEHGQFINLDINLYMTRILIIITMNHLMKKILFIFYRMKL